MSQTKIKINGEWIPISAPIKGQDGVDGTTPHIGENGNWFIGSEDTGVAASPSGGSLEDLGVTATATELNYMDGVTSNVQAQLDGKQPVGSYAATSHNHSAADINSGILAAARGGTGTDITDFPSGSIIAKSSSGAYVGYWTTVPVSKGGTGAATAEEARNNLGVVTLDEIYPIGSIYMSMNSTSPAFLFGGTWEQIEGRFLVGVGLYSETIDNVVYDYTYTAGDTGGEAKHRDTVDEMPSHNHPYTLSLSSVGYNQNYSPGTASGNFYTYQSGMVGYRGGNQPHNNMPPYIAVYMWQRVESPNG